MGHQKHSTAATTTYDPVRISYVFVAVTLILVGWLHLATPLITVLFCHFALRKFSFGVSKWLGLMLFSLVFTALIWGGVHFAKRTYVALPKIAEEAIPTVLTFAEKQNIELQFTDYESLKGLLVDTVKEKVSGLTPYARNVVVQIVSFVIGVVVAISLFLNFKIGVPGMPTEGGETLYSATFREVTLRFRTFYRSFAMVMGAQLVIAGINTLLTAAFVVWTRLPHAGVIIGLTFLLGVLPILGNLISNTLIVGVAFTISPQLAFGALVFLIAIHKLEYFLNSKVIGDRIQNPMWLTLLGLVLGEKLMGIPGMILAPVVLHFVKVEASRSRVAAAPGPVAVEATND